MKQTALDWFIYQITKNHMLAIDAISVAKDLEKQQIIDAYETGICDVGCRAADAEQYYQETFKK